MAEGPAAICAEKDMVTSEPADEEKVYPVGPTVSQIAMAELSLLWKLPWQPPLLLSLVAEWIRKFMLKLDFSCGLLKTRVHYYTPLFFMRR